MTSGLSTSEAIKTQIRHLGGGRLGREVIAENPNDSTTILPPAPGPKRDQKSRAGSMDSRVTQWLDFYTGPPESQHPPLPPHPITAQPPGLDQRPGSRVDLRPAPLRVPSSERRASPGASPTTLTRQDSISKPLPHLPTQAAVSKHPDPDKASVVANAKGESLAGETEPAACPHERPELSPDDVVRELLPPLRLVAPPVTGDAAGDTGPLRGEKGCEDGNKPLPPKPVLAHGVSQEQPSGSEAQAEAAVTFTRKERIWLHINYRGEGPFLRAWGLDITKPVDRSEGLALLRDLIQAEGEGKGLEPSRLVAKC